MRTKFFLFTALAALVLASCNNDDEGSSVSGVTFRKADISGATALGLGYGSSSTKADAGVTVEGVLYKVTADGSMVEVEYTLDVAGDDDEVSQKLKANMRLTAKSIIPIGKTWIMLTSCNYDYPGWQDLAYTNPIRKAVSYILNNTPRDKFFLIRRSDGALFEWTQEAGRHWSQMSLNDAKGRIDAVGKDIVALAGIGDGEPVLLLKDRGNTLDVITLTSNGISASMVAGLNNGKVFAVIDNNPVVIDPELKVTSISAVASPEGTELQLSPAFILNGEYYVKSYDGPSDDQYDDYGGGKKDGQGKDGQDTQEYHTALWTVSVLEYMGRLIPYADRKVAEVSGNASYIPTFQFGDFQLRMFTGTTASWINQGYRCFFDPENGILTSESLPAGYPGYDSYYYDGVAYEIVSNGSLFPDKLRRFDLSKTQPDEVNITWNDDVTIYVLDIIPSSVSDDGWMFDASAMAFKQFAKTNDGRALTWYIDAIDGSTRVSLEGESTAGSIIGTLVRLN